jgi:hypothetical protein
MPLPFSIAEIKVSLPEVNALAREMAGTTAAINRAIGGGIEAAWWGGFWVGAGSAVLMLAGAAVVWMLLNRVG